MGTSIDYDPEEIHKIRKALNASADEINQTGLHPIPASAFGGSPLGRQLATDATAAHASILATLGRVGSGLSGYSEALRKGQTGLADAEEDVKAKVQSIGLAESTIATPFATAPTTGVTPAQVTPTGRTPLPDETTPATTYGQKPGPQ